MKNEENRQELIEDLTIEYLEEESDILDLDVLFPPMNISQQPIQEIQPESFIKDDQMIGLYEEILNNCRDDRNKTDEVLSNFLEMVINDGDASSASKEAIVNLLKIKSDTSDKMSKIADLMTRVKLKEKDTFPRYLAAQQNNKVVIEGGKRDLIKSLSKTMANLKKEGKNE